MSKQESYVANILTKSGYNFERGFNPDWAGGRRYDFLIPEHHVIIEVDGKHHFEDSIGYCLQYQRNNDVWKQWAAIKHDYHFIRISYDMYHSRRMQEMRFDLEETLRECVENQSQCIITYIELTNNPKYTEFKPLYDRVKDAAMLVPPEMDDYISRVECDSGDYGNYIISYSDYESDSTTVSESLSIPDSLTNYNNDDIAAAQTLTVIGISNC